MPLPFPVAAIVARLSAKPPISPFVASPRKYRMFRQAVNQHTAARNFGGIVKNNISKPGPEVTIHKSPVSFDKMPRERISGPMRTPLGKPASAGVLNSLHDEVYFDENDIDDTIDLDEDPMASIKYPALQQAVTYPELPQIPISQTKTPHNNSSSAPFPWSSSPAWHKLPPADAAIFKPKDVVTISSSPTQEPIPRPKKRERVDAAISNPVQAPISQPKKRRNLPWNNSEPETFQTPQTSSEHSKLPSGPSPPPWNVTASTIKQQQNSLRQKNARSKKTTSRETEDAGVKPLTKGRKAKKNMASVFLSDEQKMVLDLVVEKKESVFFTGSAGTGKSVLMREIIKALRVKYAKEPDRIAVTASTGLAACHISGVTLHSFAGIGLGKESAEDLIKKIKKHNKAKNRWLRAKVLIIDEVSMLDGKLFDKLEKIARGLRNDGRPFGGIQLVVTGDFFQLPPVPDWGQEATFAFDAATWQTTIKHIIGLTHIFRQKDPDMLNEMRVGKLSQSSISTFHKLHRELAAHDSIEATELFPTRDEVERANINRMQQLEGRAFTYAATDGGSIQDIQQRTKLLNNSMAPQEITLKKGAQVMLIKNLDDGLVNGSVGKVIAFMDEQTYDLYKEDDSAEEPFDVTTSAVRASKDKRKEVGYGDVPAAAAASTTKAWPLVSFQLLDGTNRQLLCVNEKWTIELPNGEVQASRAQVPLILAWALSIHKAQGQTLERVKVDLGKVFEKGQAYVALSRATSQDGLQVLNFNPKKVMAHEKVRKFYENLSSIQDPKPLNKSASNDIAQGWIGDGFDEDSELLDYV